MALLVITQKTGPIAKTDDFEPDLAMAAADRLLSCTH
jgi:hypothetical protein